MDGRRLTNLRVPYHRNEILRSWCSFVFPLEIGTSSQWDYRHTCGWRHCNPLAWCRHQWWWDENIPVYRYLKNVWESNSIKNMKLLVGEDLKTHRYRKVFYATGSLTNLMAVNNGKGWCGRWGGRSSKTCVLNCGLIFVTYVEYMQVVMRSNEFHSREFMVSFMSESSERVRDAISFVFPNDLATFCLLNRNWWSAALKILLWKILLAKATHLF